MLALSFEKKKNQQQQKLTDEHHFFQQPHDLLFSTIIFFSSCHHLPADPLEFEQVQYHGSVKTPKFKEKKSNYICIPERQRVNNP